MAGSDSRCLHPLSRVVRVVRCPAACAQCGRRGRQWLRFFNPREKTPLSAGQVDDTPYGGGAGMVMRVDVIDAALEAAYGPDASRAAGATGPARAASSTRPSPPSSPPSLDVALLCGRYEGVDERVRDHLATDCRLDRSLRPLGRRARGDGRGRRGPAQASRRAGPRRRAWSRSRSRTRSRAHPSTRTTRGPPTYRGWGVPEILLSGDHARVDEWRARAVSRERGRSRGDRYYSALARARHKARAFPMSTIIEGIERRQLRRVPRFDAGDRVRVHFQVDRGHSAGEPRSSRAS